ncbi:MAG: anthranilate phosphoribosyltransferase, partial [Micavibrio sp.]
MSDFTTLAARVRQGDILDEDEMGACIQALMEGAIPHEDAAAFLTSLAERGESAQEIAGAARIMRAFASSITAPAGAIDCCGTGGDGHETYNISTAVALVAAACGVPVAKHGNRSASSPSGAADVLEQCGVDLSLGKEALEEALRTINFCFLMAPNHHGAMRHIAPVRKALGRRTIFNLLGPLANPAGTQKQLIGVYDREWILPVAEALQTLGTQSALIVHGADGLDEITLTGPTYAAQLQGGVITEQVFRPEDFNLQPIALQDLAGGDSAHNAGALCNLLAGQHGAYRSVVLANAAAVLYLHDGRAFPEGVEAAAKAIDSGAALNVLNR